MLTIWRRHKESCPHKSDRYYRKCRCACHIEGTLEGKYLRQSLKTRSWERAVDLVRAMEDGTKDKPVVVTLQHAVEAFLADLSAQNRAADTIRKYELLFKQLRTLGELRPITDFTFDALVKFRASWQEKGAATRNKKLDRLRAF
ncbi:MAG TPA: hypothetical protein VMB03_20070, partial [Bryobacteraceae bacterium]|nr:hypothetical protein [Bryobacteraceae bacterium]